MNCIFCGTQFATASGAKACPACERAIEQLGLGMTPDRLLELAQAEKDRRVEVVPCKKGDVLWTFCTWPRKKVYSFCVTAVSTLDGSTVLNTDKLGVIPASDVGKTVFLTCEAAEAALKNTKEATHD